MMLYEKIVVRRGKKVEAVPEGLKAMTLTRYFCKVFFFGETRIFRLQTYGKSNKMERD